EPAPERGTNTPWKTFLAAQWDGLAAADFFTVEVLTMGGLAAAPRSGQRTHRAQDHVDRHRRGQVPCAARRAAQVLRPRGRVVLWAEFSHTMALAFNALKAKRYFASTVGIRIVLLRHEQVYCRPRIGGLHCAASCDVLSVST